MKKTAITALDLLALAFIVLKLCKVITWSWWWVLSPIWITTVIVVILIIGNVVLTKRDKDDWRYK